MVSLITCSVLLTLIASDGAIVSAPQLHQFKVLRIVGDKPVSLLPDVTTDVAFVTLDETGKLLAHDRYKEIWIWNLQSKTLLGKIPNSEGEEMWRNCAFLAGCRELLVCRENGRVISYDVETLKVVREWNPQGLVKGSGFPHTLMTSPDGSQIGVTGRACALWRSNAPLATPIPAELAKGENGRFGKFSPNGKEFVIVERRAFQFFTMNPLRLVQRIETSEANSAYSFEHFAWSPNPRYFVTGQSGWLTMWDRERREVVSRVRAFTGTLQAFAFMNGGKKLIAVGQNGDFDGRIYIWDTQSGQLERGCVMVGANAMSMAISPDGKKGYLGTSQGVQIYDLDRLGDLKVEKE